MYLDILDKILCPACREDLVVEKDLVKYFNGTKTELSEGFLSCNGREEHTFLVVDGVALLVTDLTRYLSSKKNIISDLIQLATTSEAKVFIAKQISEIDEFEQNTWESRLTTSSYIWSHFDLSWEEAPWEIFLETLQIDTVGEFSSKHLMEIVNSFLPNDCYEGSLGIDIGCSVGGNTHSLSKSMSVAIGCDYSFSAIRTAREIRDTEGVYEYEFPIGEQLTETHMIDVDMPNKKKTEFVVADAKALPFKNNLADTVLSINMVDTLRDPLTHLKEANRLLAEGGYLITCDPYQWDSLPEDLFGEIEESRPAEDYGKVLRRTISEELSHELVEEQSNVPWILKLNSRSYRTFIVDCLASQKYKEKDKKK